MSEVPRLALKNITKRFPGVTANDAISFEVAPGEIHALLGENGAGKSTLVNIIYGVLQADEGDIFWEGKPVRIDDPQASRSLGIGMVFQHFSLFDAMTVLENIALGIETRQDLKSLAERVVDVSRAYGLPLDPTREVHSLSVGERQRIEIVRCLLQKPKLLIMEEPTSVLTPQEVTRLFETLRQLRGEGCSVLYISHKLEEIKQLCQRATILRDGKVVGECDPAVETAKSMAQQMISAEVRTLDRRSRSQAGSARLSVDGLDLPASGAFDTNLQAISFEVRSGEIFGIAGVAGNGQRELFQALSGERRLDDPRAIRLDGKPVGGLGPGGRRKLGLGAVPEERNGHAAIGQMSLVENALLSARQRKGLATGGWLHLSAAERFTDDIIRRFDVRTRAATATARSLSGGNLQKFVIGREVLQEPGVLVVSQPTWGVDAGAAAAIHQSLIDLAASGAAVLIISQDLDELLTLSDRLAVINLGRLSNAFDTERVSLEEIGLLMGGLHGADMSSPPALEGKSVVA
ncbi:MAG: ABC transporter ATP-binding protein [Geminicoccaceae bacterium]